MSSDPEAMALHGHGWRAHVPTAVIVAVMTALSSWLTSHAAPAEDARALEAVRQELVGKIEEVRDAQRATLDRMNRDSDAAANARELQRLRDNGQDQRLDDVMRRVPK